MRGSFESALGSLIEMRLHLHHLLLPSKTLPESGCPHTAFKQIPSFATLESVPARRIRRAGTLELSTVLGSSLMSRIQFGGA